MGTHEQQNKTAEKLGHRSIITSEPRSFDTGPTASDKDPKACSHRDRGDLPRYVVIDNGYAWTVVDSQVEDSKFEFQSGRSRGAGGRWWRCIRRSRMRSRMRGG